MHTKFTSENFSTGFISKSKNALGKPTKVEWKNIDNASFYEKLSFEANVENSILGGLEKGEELALIHSYLEDTPSVLEVGAGYGRVLNYLIKHNVQTKIYAIERSEKLCNILREHFKNKVHIYQCDLLDFDTSDKYNVILWLFCGISDFTVEEQMLVFKKLSSYLADKGIFILETFCHAKKPDNALSYEGQAYVIELEGEILQGFIPSPEMIEEYAKQVGFKKIQHIPYQTSSGSKRSLHILSK